MLAVEHANLIIGWQENLPHEETPPEWMWGCDDALNDWFEDVDRKRKKKYGQDTDEVDGPAMDNEYARSRRR